MILQKILHHVTSLAYFYHCHCLGLYKWWNMKNYHLVTVFRLMIYVNVRWSQGPPEECYMLWCCAVSPHSGVCPPTGAGTTTAAVSTLHWDSSSNGAGASVVVLYCAAAAVPTRRHHHIMWLQTICIYRQLALTTAQKLTRCWMF